MKSFFSIHQSKVIFISAMVLGYAAWVLPVVLIPGPIIDAVPIMISFSTDPELANFVRLLSLGVCGGLVGLFGLGSYKQNALLGAATGLPIVVFAIVESSVGLARHNLFGIELFMYALFTVPAVLGALVGTFLRRLTC